MKEISQTPPELWAQLKEDFEEAIADIEASEHNPLLAQLSCRKTALEYLTKLESHREASNLDHQELIQLYKEVKPFFLSHLLYFSRRYALETELATAPRSLIEGLLATELDRVTQVFKDNKFVYTYLQTAQTYLDDRWFCKRSPGEPIAMLGVSFSEADSQTGSFDHIVAHLKAAELLRKYLEQSLADIKKGRGAIDPGHFKLVWTDAKTALIELAYAWHSSKVFNNGNADLKDIIAFVEVAFHVDLGHYRRTFQEILSRKKGYTNALERYRDNLLLRIQHIEERHIK